MDTISDVLPLAEQAAIAGAVPLTVQLDTGMFTADADSSHLIAQHNGRVRQFRDSVTRVESAWGPATVSVQGDAAHPAWCGSDRVAVWLRGGRAVYLALDCPDAEGPAYLAIGSRS